MTVDSRKLHASKSCNSYSHPHFIRVINSRERRWAERRHALEGREMHEGFEEEKCKKENTWKT